MIVGKLTKWLTSYFSTTRNVYKYIQSADRFKDIVDRERKRADRGKYSFVMIVYWVKEPEKRNAIFHRLNWVLEQRLRATDVAGFVGRNRVGILLSDAVISVGRRVAEEVYELCGEEAPNCYDIYEYPVNFEESVLSEQALPSGAKLSANRADCEVQIPENKDKGNEQDQQEKNDDDDNENQSNDDQAGSGLKPEKEAGSERPEKKMGELQSAHFYNEVDFDVVPAPENPDVYECPTEKAKLAKLMFQLQMPYWKRTIDVVGSSIGLLLASPVLLLAALAVKWTSKGPVFFIQMRAGLGGRPFKMYKFRTMVVDAEEQKSKLRHLSEQDGPAFKLKHDPRITSVGRFLRKSCVDELPQLLNVLWGDMSLVGPRPLPVDEAAQITGWQNRRLDVTPGLTCIWQIDGKSAVSFTEWMRMDIRYIRARNFFQDATLVVRTVIAVLLHRASH